MREIIKIQTILHPNIGVESPSGDFKESAFQQRVKIADLWYSLWYPCKWYVSNDKSIDNYLPQVHSGILNQNSITPWFQKSLTDRSRLISWFSDTESKSISDALDVDFIQSESILTEELHSKCWSVTQYLEMIKQEDATFDPLGALSLVLEPELLKQPQSTWERIETHFSNIPNEITKNLTMKPAMGFSGRGRLPIYNMEIDQESFDSFCKRNSRYGAIVQPWMNRTFDRSHLFNISTDREIDFVVSLEQLNTPSGCCLGHRGFITENQNSASIDNQYSCSSQSPLKSDYKSKVAEQFATAIAKQACKYGYFGPMGIDSFNYEYQSKDYIHAICEGNFRFTLGMVALEIALRMIKHLELQPDDPIEFVFLLSESNRSALPEISDHLQTGKWKRIELQQIPDCSILYLRSR